MISNSEFLEFEEGESLLCEQISQIANDWIETGRKAINRDRQLWMAFSELYLLVESLGEAEFEKRVGRKFDGAFLSECAAWGGFQDTHGNIIYRFQVPSAELQRALSLMKATA